MTEDIWSGCSDSDWLKMCEIYEDSQETVTKESAKKFCYGVPYARRTSLKAVTSGFEYLHIWHISARVYEFWKKKGEKLCFDNIGFFTFYFDIDEAEAAWALISEKYLTGKLTNITKLARGKGSCSGKILVFCGPSKEKKCILQNGRSLLAVLKYRKPRSSQGYPPFIYYRLGTKNVLYPGGPTSYSLSY